MREDDVAAPPRSVARAAREVATRDLSRAEVLDLRETRRAKRRAQIVRLEKCQPRFAELGDPRGPLLVGRAHLDRKRLGRVAVVEDEVSAALEPTDESERGFDGLLLEIRHDAEPREERRGARVET